MRTTARRAATFVVVLLGLFALSPRVHAQPSVQLATTLTVEAAVNGRQVAVSGRLVDVRDRGIANARLQLKLDATALRTVATDAAGRWSATVSIPQSTPAGDHNIFVTYGGADAYKPAAASVAVKLDPPGATTDPTPTEPALKPTTLTATVPAEAQLWGSVVTVTGTLTGPDGARISGAPITVTGAGGVRSDCLTDDAGGYSCEIAVPDVNGPVTLQASFTSMQGFAGATANATLQAKAPPTPTQEEEEVVSESPSTTASPSAGASSAPASAPASATSSAVAVPPNESNYTPLLIALVGAFAVLGLGVLGLSLLRNSRKEPVEKFIEPDDESSFSLIGDPGDEALPEPEPAASRGGRYAAVSTTGSRFGSSGSRSANPNAPRRALD